MTVAGALLQALVGQVDAKLLEGVALQPVTGKQTCRAVAASHKWGDKRRHRHNVLDRQVPGFGSKKKGSEPND